jgi:hypothetical protein
MEVGLGEDALKRVMFEFVVSRRNFFDSIQRRPSA